MHTTHQHPQSATTFVRALVIVFSVLSISFFGCDGGPTGTDDRARRGVFARINGVEFATDSTVFAGHDFPGQYIFNATSASGSGYSFQLSLVGIHGVGTYAMGTSESIGGGEAYVFNESRTGEWITPQTGTAGVVTITTLTDKRMIGTFSFVATPLQGSAAGSVTVTNGSFDLALAAGAISDPMPPYLGGKFSTVISGVTFTPANAKAMFGTPPAQLQLGAANRNFAINVFIQHFDGVGTYTLNTTTGTNLSVLHFGPGGDSEILEAWSTLTAGSAGTLTISSITNDRITGSFTATLAQGTGSPKSPLVFSGTFDVGRWR